jgi:transcriptional regulator with XRE-family HTH domain
MLKENEIGKRIKEYRKDRGISLQGLAEKTGYTKGYLSKIEKAEKAPPVSTIINIAKALNITLPEIFGETGENCTACLVNRSERHDIARDGTVFGYAYQTLAHKFLNKHMDPYILTLPVSPREKAIFQHKGEEMLFVLEGTMKFFHGEKEFIMKEGDCLYFDGSIPHYGFCLNNEEVKCLMVIYTPE